MPLAERLWRARHRVQRALFEPADESILCLSSEAQGLYPEKTLHEAHWKIVDALARVREIEDMLSRRR